MDAPRPRAAVVALVGAAAAFALFALWLPPLLAAHAWRAFWTLVAGALLAALHRWAAAFVAGAYAGGVAWVLMAPTLRLPWPDTALGLALNAAMLAAAPLDAVASGMVGAALVAGAGVGAAVVAWRWEVGHARDVKS